MKILILCFAASIAAAGSPDGLKLKVVAGRPVAGGVFVDGQGPFTFLLDTGAESNQISVALAEKLGWRPAFRTEVVTSTGSAWRPGCVASTVELGPARAERQEFLITPLDEIRTVSRDIDGVLGQAFLSRFDYRLDLRRGRLQFGSAGEAGLKVPFDLSDGRMIVSTSRGRLVVDTGANAVVLWEARDLAATAGVLRTASGSAQVRMGTLNLRIGARQFRNVIAAVAGGAKREPLEPDGLLPASILGSIYVANSGGYLILED